MFWLDWAKTGAVLVRTVDSLSMGVVAAWVRGARLLLMIVVVASSKAKDLMFTLVSSKRNNAFDNHSVGNAGNSAK